MIIVSGNVSGREMASRRKRLRETNYENRRGDCQRPKSGFNAEKCIGIQAVMFRPPLLSSSLSSEADSSRIVPVMADIWL
jgi:hypothetical protein